MKDIDFDELDRAVGSVLGAGARTPKTSGDVTATATLAPEPAAAEPAVATDTVDTPAANESTTPSPKPAISQSVSPARKRGQFLDMVHPSANMRKTTLATSNTRKTLAPLNKTITPDNAATKDPVDSVTEQSKEIAPATTSPETEATVTPVVEVPEKNNSANESQESPRDAAWPDPLDFVKDDNSTEQPQPADAETEQPASSYETHDNTPGGNAGPAEVVAKESVQTPFVTDAHVDKRPLGAFATTEDEPHDDPAPAETSTPTESKDDTPEFNPEVNSIESTGVPQAEKEETGFTGEAPEESEALAAEQPEAPVTEAKETAVAPDQSPSPDAEQAPMPSPDHVEPAATSTTDSSVNGVAQSIPQQYKTAEPHKDDDALHPLFDTEEYHQPLLADGKKKSKKGVLIVVLLLILLIIGGALGYFAYTMGI